MNIDLIDSQRSALIRMLQFKTESSTADLDTVSQQWKVLIYDKYCQDIIAPLLKVGQLRSNGVTLHLSIKAERMLVPDVPAIYFVEPTEENVARIVADYKAGLYTYMHINFASSVSSKMLQRFASEVSSVNPLVSCQISRVIDRYCSFVSLEPCLYSLNLPSTYMKLHQATVSEVEIEQSVDRMAQGLLSLIITSIKQVPVIRAASSEAAGMVAQSLFEKLSELVSFASSSDLFSAHAAGSADPTHAQRPLLVILDRSMDLSPMVAHGWSYAGLMSDLLGMQSNKLSIPAENKHFDIDPVESFYRKNAHMPFPDAATAVNELVTEFNRMRSEVTSDNSHGGSGFSSAVHALPQVTEMKKTVDMHTTIATSLLNVIKSRSIDKFYEVETAGNVSALLPLIGEAGSVSDQVRAAIVLILGKKDGLSPAKIDELISKLEAAVTALPNDQVGRNSIKAVRYVKYLLSLRNMSAPSSSTPPSSMKPQVVLPGMLGGLAEQVKSRGEGLLAAGMKNLKSMLPVNDNFVVTNTVQQLADQLVNPLTDSFLYLDAKSGASATRVRGSFRQVIVCVVGGGCVSEFENISVWASKTGRTVVYGGSDLPSAEMFVGDLAKLAL